MENFEWLRSEKQKSWIHIWVRRLRPTGYTLLETHHVMFNDDEATYTVQHQVPLPCTSGQTRVHPVVHQFGVNRIAVYFP